MKIQFKKFNGKKVAKGYIIISIGLEGINLKTFIPNSDTTYLGVLRQIQLSVNWFPFL